MGIALIHCINFLIFVSQFCSALVLHVSSSISDPVDVVM